MGHLQVSGHRLCTSNTEFPRESCVEGHLVWSGALVDSILYRGVRRKEGETTSLAKRETCDYHGRNIQEVKNLGTSRQ